METLHFVNIDDLRKYIDYLDAYQFNYVVKQNKQYCCKLKVDYYVYTLVVDFEER